MKRKTPTPQQLTFDDARKPSGWGGWRPGAGRPKGRSRVPHEEREEFSSRDPLHVTLRLVRGLPTLRNWAFLSPLRGQLALSHTDDFRIAHFNIEDNHLHLIVECTDQESLSAHIGALNSRLARRINRLMGRTGELFDDRYHSRVLRTPREVRNALRYVLNNYRHHAADHGEYVAPTWFDPFSSAAWFDGWTRPLVGDEPWKAKLLAMPAPTAAPRTWLLRTGWRKAGLIGIDEIPGQRAPHRKK